MPPIARLSALSSVARAASFVLLAAALVSPGCSSSQPRARVAQDSGDRPYYVADEGETPPHQRLGYRLEWRGFPFLTEGSEPRFFDVADDVLIFHDSKNNLTLMENGTGRIRWSTRVGAPLRKFIGNVRAGDNLIVSSETDVQIIDLATGNLRDRQRLAVLANTRPAVVSGVAVFGCTTGEVLGHSLLTRYKLWGYALNGVITADPVAVRGADVAVVSQAGDVIIINAETGSAEGRRNAIFDGLSNNPIADERLVYVAGRDQSVWAFDATTGNVRWRLRTESPITAQPVLHDDRVYITLPREGFVALDARTGERVWGLDNVTGRVVGVRAGRLLVWSPNRVVLVDPERGEIVDDLEIPDLATVVCEPFVDGFLYSVTPEGVVDKFAPLN
ncbi:MAG: PQQ-binding-like beta-propeller repeat protein [Planctomycetota bacterium]